MLRLIYCAGALATAWIVHADEPRGAKAPLTIDFEKFQAGTLPDELMAVEGEFRIAELDGRKVLELLPQPVADGAVLLGPSMSGAGSIRANVKAEKSRRAFPRFGVGLHGISGTKLRVVPAQKMIEIVRGEEQISRADFDWQDARWLSVELIVKESSGTWTAEGRVWAGDGKRPDKPLLTAKLASAPGQGKASVIGTPYANKPVHFDDVAIGP